MTRRSLLRFLPTPAFLLGCLGLLSQCGTNTVPAVVGPLPDPPHRLTATLNGASQRPAVTSAGSGTFEATVDKATRLMSYTITFAGITPSAGSLNRITQPDGTGPYVVRFPLTLLRSPIQATYALSPPQLDSLLKGQWYVNFPTNANPGGEIRGDIRAR